MPDYFYDQNGSQAGPIAADQLLNQGVTATTLVWRDGMPDWVAAATVPELSTLFRAIPPPLPPLPITQVPQPVSVPLGVAPASTTPDEQLHQGRVSGARPQFSSEASTRKWWHYLIYAIAVIFMLLFFRACGTIIRQLLSVAPTLPQTEYKTVAHVHRNRLLSLVS